MLNQVIFKWFLVLVSILSQDFTERINFRFICKLLFFLILFIFEIFCPCFELIQIFLFYLLLIVQSVSNCLVDTTYFSSGKTFTHCGLSQAFDFLLAIKLYSWRTPTLLIILTVCVDVLTVSLHILLSFYCEVSKIFTLIEQIFILIFIFS